MQRQHGERDQYGRVMAGSRFWFFGQDAPERLRLFDCVQPIALKHRSELCEWVAGAVREIDECKGRHRPTEHRQRSRAPRGSNVERACRCDDRKPGAGERADREMRDGIGVAMAAPHAAVGTVATKTALDVAANATPKPAAMPLASSPRIRNQAATKRPPTATYGMLSMPMASISTADIPANQAERLSGPACSRNSTIASIRTSWMLWWSIAPGAKTPV